METFLIAFAVFAIAFLGMALGAFRHKQCLGCSCKAAGRVMNRKTGRCGEGGSLTQVSPPENESVD